MSVTVLVQIRSASSRHPGSRRLPRRERAGPFRARCPSCRRSRRRSARRAPACRSCFPLRRSPLLVRVEDVVLRLYRYMACVTAVGFGLVGCHLAGRGVMVEECISPAAGLRKSLAVLLDEERLRGGGRYIHDEGGLRALLEAPLELRDLGAFRETLAVARNAGLVRLDHGRVADDDL